jgi:hypothetical protein
VKRVGLMVEWLVEKMADKWVEKKVECWVWRMVVMKVAC